MPVSYLIDSNPRAAEYHAARIAHAPVAVLTVVVAVAITPALMALRAVRDYCETYAAVMDPQPGDSCSVPD